MSGTMHAYAVDLGRLRAITAQPSNRDEPLSTSPQAERLRRLLAGEAPSQSTYDDYVDLEWLCASLGTPLSSRACAGTKLDLLLGIDARLPAVSRQYGISFERLLMSGPPLKLPMPNDFPMTGHLEADVVRAWHHAMTLYPLESSDPYADDVFVELEDWIGHAAARDVGLVTFYQ